MAKNSSHADRNERSKDEWKKSLSDIDPTEVYLCWTCALSHNLDLNRFLGGAHIDSYVSLLFIVNVTGSDKKELLMVGKDIMEDEENVCSLPVNYYYCSNGLLNYSAVLDYLSKWDKELVTKEKCVKLLLDETNTLIRNSNFKNIRMLNAIHLDYFNHIKGKIIKCFKYQYRKLQISRTLTHGKHISSFVDNVHMIGMAWNNVPQKYVQSLSLLPEKDGHVLDFQKENDCNYSLSRWCKLYNVPLNIEHNSNALDEYLHCDIDLPCVYYGQLENVQTFEVLSQKSCQPTSGIDAYQAMKRIISYLQGEGAIEPVVKYAKYLENHLEYGALVQLHQVAATAKGGSI